MKLWKKLTMSMILAGSIFGGMAGCSSNTGDDEVPTLVMFQVGDRPENLDELMEIANARIEEEIGVRLDLQYIGWGDYEQRMSVMINAGGEFDIAYSSGSMNYVTNAQRGAFADLTDLLPKLAPEAYEMLDPAYIKGNSINGRLYAFPVNGNVYAQQMLTFNQQFLDKYDLDISGVTTYGDLEPLLRVISENEPTVTPFSVGQGFRVASDLDFILGDNMPFAVDLLGDGATIINAYDNERMQGRLREMHHLFNEGLIPQNAAISNTSHPLDGSTWFVRQETQGPFDYGDTLLTTVAGQPLVSVPITEAVKTTAQAQMANFVISSNSEFVEEAVQVLGLLNSDPELLNGLVNGIEGEAWERVGEDRMRFLEGNLPNHSMSAWNTGNNRILFVDEAITDEQIAQRDANIEAAKQSPILGFNFDMDSVRTEISNISNVMNQYLDGLHTGTLDPDVAIPELNEQLEIAGLSVVMEEMQRQFDEFLAAQ